MPKPKTEKICVECSRYIPMHHGIGRCAMEGSVLAKFFVSGGKEPLMVLASFGCQQFTEKEALSKDVL